MTTIGLVLGLILVLAVGRALLAVELSGSPQASSAHTYPMPDRQP